MNVRSREQTVHGRFILAGLFTLIFLFGVESGARAQIEELKSQGDLDTTAEKPRERVEGRLTIAGSDTMRPILVKLATDFIRNNPKAKIAVEGGGSTQGLREFVLGLSFQRRGDKARGTGTEGAATATIFASSRALDETEHGRFISRFGYEPIAMPIALDAVAVYVHARNPIPQLSLEQLAQIYGTGEKTVTTWGQLGVENALGQAAIDAYGRDNRSGTKTFFSELVLHGKPQKPNILEEPGSASQVLSIARNPAAIGYAGIGFNISEVRIVPLVAQNATTPILPTDETVHSGAYPLSRPLYLYINSPPHSKMHPVLYEFLHYVNSSRGQAMVKAANAYPLSQSQLEKNRRVIEEASK